METNTKTKKIGEVFSDYKTSSNIQYATIEALNIIKNKKMQLSLL